MGNKALSSHQKKYVYPAGMILIPTIVILFVLSPYRIWRDNKEMAREYAKRGRPWTMEDVPILPGGYGDPKEQKRRYEEAKKKGVTLTTWETDYMAIKDKMIAEKIAAQQQQKRQQMEGE